jgi:hypothetical protein
VMLSFPLWLAEWCAEQRVTRLSRLCWPSSDRSARWCTSVWTACRQPGTRHFPPSRRRTARRSAGGMVCVARTRVAFMWARAFPLTSARAFASLRTPARMFTSSTTPAWARAFPRTPSRAFASSRTLGPAPLRTNTGASTHARGGVGGVGFDGFQVAGKRLVRRSLECAAIAFAADWVAQDVVSLVEDFEDRVHVGAEVDGGGGQHRFGIQVTT